MIKIFLAFLFGAIVSITLDSMLGTIFFSIMSATQMICLSLEDIRNKIG